MLASMSSTHGRSSASRTECIRLGRIQAALAGLVDALQRPAQRVLADDLGHAQRLRGHGVAAQRGDVRVAPVPGQQPSISVPSTSRLSGALPLR
jgi:hypothetical protein